MGLAQGTGLRLGAYGLGGLLSLAALPLLIRHLGVADFGHYVAVLSIVGIAALAGDLGITALALRDSALAGAERRPELVAGLLGARVVISLFGGLLAIGFAAAADYGAIRSETIPKNRCSLVVATLGSLV